jgi:hypothetical protein
MDRNTVKGFRANPRNLQDLRGFQQQQAADRLREMSGNSWRARGASPGN